VASQARGAALLPLLVLLAFGLVFGAASLGVSPPAFDDHPGQLYRLWHVVTLGPAPWAWNDGWWTGYPELQFYPPAFAYAGALLHTVTLGALSVPAAYHALLWLVYLAPGVTVWIALAPRLASGWLALPGAFVALTLSLWPALASGVEGGVHVGMVPARLAWSALPLLAAALAPWCHGAGAFPARAVVPLTAGIVLTHPAHLPAAVTLVVLAALSVPERLARIVHALRWLVVAALVTSFWTVPLLARLADTRALAWGTLTPRALGDVVRSHPLVIVLAILALVAIVVARSAAARVLAWWPWAIAVVVALDALMLEPLGARWLPSDRVMDSFWLALVLTAGLGAGRLLERVGGRRAIVVPALGIGAALVAVGLSTAGDGTLAVRAKASAWPSYPATERGLRLPALWAALRAAPPGRVLFVRSGVPLVYSLDWWRPHTHITALTPLRASRAIVNGTFTHPSPTAALVYRGTTQGGAITELVERLDGRSLFGRPLDTLDVTTFNEYARRLGVSVVVALDEDGPALRALADNPLFASRRIEPPFILWQGPPISVPQPDGPGRWQTTLATETEGWVSAMLAYYPLWRAAAGGRTLPTRRGSAGELEVQLPAGRSLVELSYGPGAIEWTGLTLTGLGLVVWLVASWRRA
jgi:hypothetical protein